MGLLRWLMGSTKSNVVSRKSPDHVRIETDAGVFEMRKSGNLLMVFLGKRPVPWGNKAGSWREFLASGFEAMCKQIGPPQFNNGGWYKVRIDYFFTAKKLESSDLDNLAKPVLDTFFYARQPNTDPKLTGVLVHDDDARVGRLELAKRLAEDANNEGIVIEIAIMSKPD